MRCCRKIAACNIKNAFSELNEERKDAQSSLLNTLHGMGRCLGMSGRLMISASEMPLLLELFVPWVGGMEGSSWGSMGASAGSFWGWMDKLRSVLMGGRSSAGLL